MKMTKELWIAMGFFHSDHFWVYPFKPGPLTVYEDTHSLEVKDVVLGLIQSAHDSGFHSAQQLVSHNIFRKE